MGRPIDKLNKASVRGSKHRVTPTTYFHCSPPNDLRPCLHNYTARQTLHSFIFSTTWSNRVLFW